MDFVKRNWRGLTVLALGLITLPIAHYLLDSCGDAGKMLATAQGAQIPMRCSWTERAVQGIGGLVSVLGLIMIWTRDSVRGLSLATAASGILMIITPIWLIPTCSSAMMVCNLSLKPGTLLLGGLITLVGIGLSLKSPQFEKRERMA